MPGCDAEEPSFYFRHEFCVHVDRAAMQAAFSATRAETSESIWSLFETFHHQPY